MTETSPTEPDHLPPAETPPPPAPSPSEPAAEEGQPSGAWRGGLAILMTLLTTLISVFEFRLIRSIGQHGFNTSAGGGGDEEGCRNAATVIPTMGVGFLFGGVFLVGALMTVALGRRLGSKPLVALGLLAAATSIASVALGGKLLQQLLW